MIIFGPNFRVLPPEFFAIYNIRNLIIYNLSTYDCSAPSLNALIPDSMLMQIVSDEEKTFDINYANYIIGNDAPFMDLMKIIIPLYNDQYSLVFIMVNNSDFRNTITESLIKLIQQRYGYNSIMINTPEDAMSIEDDSFSLPGILVMDSDYKRYIALSNMIEENSNDK